MLRIFELGLLLVHLKADKKVDKEVRYINLEHYD